jgi:lysophospholipase L1-like esterase
MEHMLRKIIYISSAIAVIALALSFTILHPALSHQSSHMHSKLAKSIDVYYDPGIQPQSITRYTAKHPAASNTFLIWHNVSGAVYYELELLSAPPEQENNITLSSKHHLFSTKEIYTNGWQTDLTPYLNEPALYWRVRAIDFFDRPVGAFSTAERIYMDPDIHVPDKPLLNPFDRSPDFQQPLYPVYDWIPLHDPTLHYEVELLSAPPEQENNTLPSSYRIWHSDITDSASYYDNLPRTTAGDYWWRVRAVDSDGNTIGVYSDAQKMTIHPLENTILAAAFGDSITHGGGALSYSPANAEYSYESYLDFPALNLGRSGDTARMSEERFDSDVLPFHPQNLLILCGSNDLRDGSTSAEDIILELQKIKLKCEQNGIRPIFLTLMPINPENIYHAFQTETDEGWHEKLATVNRFIRTQPYYIDLEPHFYNRSGELARKYATDGLHGDIKGKQLMAQIINDHRYLLQNT